jgi:putative N6-adenine-specific DNA methylase
MNLFDRASRIIVTCNKRLAPFLEKEIQELGFTAHRTFQTGVELSGTVKDCIRLNLNLRCASQVLYSLKELSIQSPEDLYKKLMAFPWEKLIPVNGYVSVTSNVSHPSINNELFVNVKVKDAIVDRIRRETGKRPDSGSHLDRSVVHLYWKESRAEIFLDTSGETLAKHGYRKVPGKAPMLEALATATLMATKWDRTSPFINPMCGSGTLAIEAVLLATNRRPGLFRSNYSFMHISHYQNKLYEEEIVNLKSQIQGSPDLKVLATDLSADAIKISRINAKAAGVDTFISFDQCDFEKTDVPEGAAGVIFFNPEYGERLGDVQALEKTYSRIGDFMKKKCRGYTGYIFTGNLDLAKKIGLRARRRIEFYSAKLDCRLLEFDLYEGSRET